MISGLTAGIAARAVTHPLERLRILQQTGNPEYAKIRGTMRSLVYMFEKEGMRGLFRGNGLNTLIQAPFTACEFFFYDFYKNNIFADPD